MKDLSTSAMPPRPDPAISSMRARPHDGVVIFGSTTTPPLTPEALEAEIGYISDVLNATGHRLMVLDSREVSGVFPHELRAAFWDWVCETPLIHAIAFIANDPKIRTRINLTSFSRGVHARGFNDLDEAVSWLTSLELTR